ncbi:hypothetical protein BDZ89DRAFT_1032149 [Hymenopellis radicata]|nr:hypothetical protein BDZ89DRAFT_1032149 [Hymenopellis radicata]
METNDVEMAEANECPSVDNGQNNDGGHKEKKRQPGEFPVPQELLQRDDTPLASSREEYIKCMISLVGYAAKQLQARRHSQQYKKTMARLGINWTIDEGRDKIAGTLFENLAARDEEARNQLRLVVAKLPDGPKATMKQRQDIVDAGSWVRESGPRIKQAMDADLRVGRTIGFDYDLESAATDAQEARTIFQAIRADLGTEERKTAQSLSSARLEVQTMEKTEPETQQLLERLPNELAFANRPGYETMRRIVDERSIAEKFKARFDLESKDFCGRVEGLLNPTLDVMDDLSSSKGLEAEEGEILPPY